MNYLIRKCEEKDLPEVIELCRKHAAFERESYLEGNKKEGLKKALFKDNPSLYCWVVEVQEKLVGYASYTFDFSTWDAAYFLYLDCLYLEPDYRGAGIGADLMRHLLAVAKAEGCVNMQWQTPDFNENAIAFYKKMGGVNKEKIRFTIPIVED